MPPPKVKKKTVISLPNNARLKTAFEGKQITLRVDMTFISDPKFMVVEVLK
jgi:hypothetical protein